jgi:hypothetical protein
MESFPPINTVRYKSTLMPISKLPTEFELKVIKWLFLPVFSILLMLALKNYFSQKNKCDYECRNIGYSESLYVARNRGSEEQCLCLEQTDSEEIKKEIYLK